MDRDQAASTLWDFLKAEGRPTVSDAIFVFGGWNMDVAHRAAELYLEGWAPLAVVSGNRGRATANWNSTEAHHFSLAMAERGMPLERIIAEHQATNSEENVLFGLLKLQEQAKLPRSLLVVSIPFMMRRCLALFAKNYPDIRITACPPVQGLEYYRDIASYDLYERLAGEIRRLKDYPSQGFFDPVPIPPEVEAAYLILTEGASTVRKPRR